MSKVERKPFTVLDGAPSTVAFSVGGAVPFSGEMVRRRGKIWECGTYPDKKFAMTPEELADAVAAFTPVPTDLEHTDTLLSGKLGHLASVEIGDDPRDLFGTVEIPRWLSDECPADLPVSVAWDRQTKRIASLALVVEPRVADAAVAAFAKRHDTPTGQMAMQDMHDTAARHGAVCKAPTANMASRHESSAIQSMHDAAVEHGATCAAVGNRGGGMPWFSKERVMNVKQVLQAWFSAGMPDEFEPREEATTPPAAVAAAQPDPQVTALQAEVTRLKAESITREAAAFADGEITAGRAFPAERDALLAAFSQAASDDATHGVVTFSGGVTKSRAQILRDAYAARPAHTLTQEMLPNGLDAEALFNTQTTPTAGADKPASRERVAMLLAASPLGRAALDGQKN